MLRVEGLVAGYEGAGRVLDGVDRKSAPANRSALLGRNGMGKTTLLRAIMGLVAPVAGCVAFEGREIDGRASVHGQSRRDRLRASGPRDLPGFHGRGEPSARSDRQAAPAAGSAGFDLSPSRCWRSDARRAPAPLLGGEQQQLAIARALIEPPAPAAARRAVRGHPALDGAGGLGATLDSRSPPRGRLTHAAGRAEPRPRAAACRPAACSSRTAGSPTRPPFS